MTDIVLNEKQWVEDAISASKLGNKPSETLGRLARYYHEIGYKKSEIHKMLEEFMIRCDPNINVVRWQPVIDNSIRYAWKGSLIMIDPIAVTQSEMDSISKLSSVLLQRLMFTLVCLAKYGNAVNPNNNSWVNRDIKEILALANIKMTVRRQSLLFNDLWCEEYIGFSNIVDNINVNVKILDDTGEVAMRIDDFRNLGNQYMQYVGEGYMTCKNCGLVVKRNAPNQKYCKDCAIDINIQKTAENRSQFAA